MTWTGSIQTVCVCVGGIRSLLVSKENNAVRDAIQTVNPPTDQRAGNLLLQMKIIKESIYKRGGGINRNKMILQEQNQQSFPAGKI